MIFALLFAAFVCVAGNLRAQLSGTIVDFGGTAPVPGASDVSQLTSPGGANSPDGLNYYFDNGTPPGQTFTTGNNPSGYVLNSINIQTAGNGNLPAAGQAYTLYLYSVSGTTAKLMYSFNSQGAFTFTETDWLLWTNLTSVGLQPNTQYAYTLHRVTTGWENLANVTGNPYAGGEVCLIPTAGGAITFGSSHGFDATFNVGLTPATTVLANPPVIAPQSAVVLGTAVTISTPPAVGGGTITYQWQTDGGSGGTLTNIPAATSTNLSVNTAGMLPGSYQYAVVASSGGNSSTSLVVSLTLYQVTGGTMTDAGVSFAPGQYDISQLVENTSQNGDGLNYYDDNGNSPGQTFTTGTNSQGYYLSSISMGTGGGTFNSTTTPQGYNLWLYSISGNKATLLINYTNPSSSFVYGDWVTWKFSPFILKPNSTYAYAFHRNSAGWAGMATDAGDTDLYTNGQTCLIPQGGGTIVTGNSGTVDAAFDIGVVPIGQAPTVPFANGIAISPSQFDVIGTQVTLTEMPTGATPFYYLWQTDGGTGGALTNIPSSNNSNLVWNTSGWAPGNYQFDVIVTNSYGASTSLVATVTLTYADTSGVLSDIGTTTPSPLPDDISQLTIGLGARKPDGLNYYLDNGAPPGQTFTTGTDPSGYTLTSLAVHLLAGDSGQIPPGGQAYQLRLYTVSGSTAVLYATYTSQTNFVFVDGDWLRWSGLSLPLAASTSYAYAFGRVQTGSGWADMDNYGGDAYPGGEVALLPLNGGTIVFGSSHTYDAAFVLGMTTAGFPAVSPPVFSPSDTVYAGTPLSASATVTGQGSFTYQWQTDGGNTGTFTNIPGATAASVSVDTTPLSGIVGYRLVAANSSGSTTGELASVTINPASPPMVTSPFSLSENNLVIVGGTVTLRVNETGTLPITNLWTFNGSPLIDNGHITGSGSNILTIMNVQSSDAGYYQLNLTNSVGSYSAYPSGGADQNLTVVPIPTFFTNGPGWTAGGSASIANNVLTLTTGTGQTSEFFLSSTIYIGAFQASFIYQDVGGGGADGFTLCFENDPRGSQASGGGGGQLGVSGITPSAELTFNIYNPNTPGISFGTNGANGAPYNPTTPVNIDSGDFIAVNVLYQGGVMQVTLTDTNTSATFTTNISANLPAIVGSQQAYIGFTGASGGVGSTQTITDFLYVPLTSLSAKLAGSNMVLSWPMIPGGYTLLATPSLSSPKWQSATGTVYQISGQNQVTNGVGSGSQFYRLAVPIPPQ
jgi:hypothetical protein